MRAEKRKKQRKSLQRKVWIELDNGTPAIECALGNMSDSGAKLILSEQADDLPNQFVLLLAQDGRVARQCRMAWRYGDEIGVEFIARRIGPALSSGRPALAGS